MRIKSRRLEAIKKIISSQEIGSQEDLLNELNRQGYQLTQATLSRDLKQLKVAKAASMSGNYVYVLPNDTLYKRLTGNESLQDMMRSTGFVSIEFSGNMAVIKTRPGYASSLAYDIDVRHFEEILGTIAGDDTILLIIREHYSHTQVRKALQHIITNINQ